MKYIVIEHSESNFTLAEKSLGNGSHYFSVAAFRSKIQAQKVCEILNQKEKNKK